MRLSAALFRRILMCSPEHFTVNYAINVHMKPGVDAARAQKQWDSLKDTLKDCGAAIEVMPGVAGLPDLVFTANAAVVRGRTAYLAHFKHPERQPERQHYKSWLSSAGFRSVGLTTLPNEGAGDALFAGPDRLFAAHGLRTDWAVYEDMAKELSSEEGMNPVRLVECELVDPRWYHIDTAFCPIREDCAIWYPAAFSPESRKRMESELELIAVSEVDAMNFACNSVTVGKHSVLHHGSKATEEALAKAGQTVHTVDLSEFIKAGGSAKCLTLALD